MTATIMASCGAKTAVVNNNTTITATSKQDDAEDLQKQQLVFMQKVADNAVYQQNIVSRLNFTLTSGTKNITVPGSIHMRKDDVIRIQLFMPLLGTEVGRLEFTKDYVMIIDRLHKEYIKGDYNKIGFLKRQGINFYSLQALFWNQLFLPGESQVKEEQLSLYTVDMDATNNNIITLLQQKMLFQWEAEKDNGNITDAKVEYKGDDNDNAILSWKYADFRSFGSKQFPHVQKLRFQMDKKDVNVTLDMNGVTSDNRWETRTTVSDRYKEVTAEEVLKKLTTL